MPSDAAADVIAAEHRIEVGEDEVPAARGSGDRSALRWRQVPLNFPFIGHGTFEDQEVSPPPKLHEVHARFGVAGIGQAFAAGFNSVAQSRGGVAHPPRCDRIAWQPQCRFVKLLQREAIAARGQPSVKRVIELPIQGLKPFRAIDGERLGSFRLRDA